MSADYEYHAFVSYTTADVAWAARLVADLRTKHNLRIFFAPDSIRGGALWSAALTENLEKSQHLVVLMSSAVQNSDFVAFEIAAFKTELVRVDADVARKQNRRIIEVQLDRAFGPLAEFQAITTLKNAGAYAVGPNWIDANIGAWNSMVREIADSLNAGADATPITAAVLAMTLDEVRKLVAEGGVPPGPEPIHTILAKFGMEPTMLDTFYGEKRHDWKPFGNREDVRTVLDKMRAALEDKMRDALDDQVGGNLNDQPAERFRIEYVQPEFWSEEPSEVRPEAAKLGRGLAALVIDPISLYNFTVQSRLKYLQACFKNPHAAVMMLSPFTVSTRGSSLRSFIERIATDMYDKFYDPPIAPSESQASFSLLTSDDRDIKRTMLALLRDFRVRQAMPGTTVPYFGAGSSSR